MFSAEFRRRSILVFRACLILLCLRTAGLPAAFAQRDLKDIPPPDPALEQATFRLPEGFSVNLFAADPAIAKPIQMNFDPQGRLWLVSSEVYPQIEPGAEANDRVLVLEDADGDGVSDLTHVFAEGLLIPTAVAPGNGGAWVGNSTELLHYEDTDGDLRADRRRVVLSGFGTEDTHHILHTLRWGPDGYLYFNQSIYIHSHIETPWGVRRLNAGGIWQFRPETLELGVLMYGLVNSWGHHFDRFGQSFATDGAGGEGINYIIPGASYFTAANADRIVHGLNPGSPKHCGLEIVETPQLPPDWQGSAVTNDFRGHRVCRFTLEPNGSGYISREQQEVIASDHVAFRPVDVKQGPDGAIYIADWYNPIIQHGEVDFRDPRRDHTHGRIWRVTWDGAPDRDRVTLSGDESPADLLTRLSSPDGFERQAAHQLLREGDPQAVADAVQERLTGIAALSDHEQLELLWTVQSVRRTDAELCRRLLTSEDARIRAAAVRVLSHWRYEIPNSFEWLSERVSDPHPQVRMEAVRALSFSPLEDCEFQTAWMNADDSERRAELLQMRSDPKRIETAMLAVDHPVDSNLEHALRLTSRELAESWLPAYESGETDFGGDTQKLLTAVTALGERAPAGLVAARLRDAGLTAEQQSRLAQFVASSRNAEAVEIAVTAAVERNDADLMRLVLRETERTRVRPSPGAQYLQAWLDSDDPTLKAEALRAAGQFRSAGYQETLIQAANDESLAAALRSAALDGMVRSADPQLRKELLQFGNESHHPYDLRMTAAALLAEAAPRQAAATAVALLADPAAAPNAAALAESFLRAKAGADVLAEGLKDRRISSAAARELLRAVRLSGTSADGLQQAVIAAGELTARRVWSEDEKAEVLQQAESADPQQGEIVFRDSRFGCLKCHAVGGAGGKVGPDMSSLGASGRPDYILESLLVPNAKVKEGYHTTVVITDDGRVRTGVRVRESETQLVLRNAEGELLTVDRQTIEETGTGLSLMPEGLVDQLTVPALASLVRFLSELGRTEAYRVGVVPLVRSWEVMEATDEAAFRLRRTSYAQAATDDPAFRWQAAFSTVSGDLPLEDIPTVSVRNRSAAGARGVGFARFVIDQPNDGTVELEFNSIDGLELRVGDRPFDLNKVMRPELSAGRHVVTLTVDKEQRAEPVRIQIR